MTDETKTVSEAPAATAQLDMAGGALQKPLPEAVAKLDDASTAKVTADEPLERARANGYVEEPAPSHDERVNALIADVEHAMAHNAPMTPAILAEMKALLKGE